MNRTFNLAAIFPFLTIMIWSSAIAQQSTADSVRAEFLHAWSGYKQYAWGHDALKPLSKQSRDWYGKSFCMTPVDAYDVLMVMGLSDEAVEAKKLIFDSLSFNRD